MLVSQETFNLKSTITDDWGGSHRVEIDLEALAKAQDWELGISLPGNYAIDQIYGGELTEKDGQTYISGKNWNGTLNEGDSVKIVLIVLEGDSSDLDPIKPEFTFADSIDSNSTVAELNRGSQIIEDWDGGYKLELEIGAENDANDWKLDFNLPFTISEAYGVDLVDQGNGSYTISGQNDQANLQAGQSIKPILIVEDNGQEAIAPTFDSLVERSEAITTPVSNKNKDTKDLTVDSVEQPVTIPDSDGQSVPQQGQFPYAQALQKNFLFLEANRSGSLTPQNRIQWRSDSTTNDGSTVGRDLEGGYFDAGDHVKFGQPMAASVNMLAWGGVEYTDAYQQSGQFDELLDAVKWGTDYFLKAHETENGQTAKLWVQVGEGGSDNDHGYWGAPETVEANTTRNAFAIDPSNPGSDVAASTSSALAAASMLFRGVDDVYADELLKNAKQLYDFAETYQGKYSDSVTSASPFYTSWSGYGDELASGAAWLAKATGQESYLNKAENYFKNNVGGLGDWSWAVDDHSYGAAVILAQESEDPFFKGQVEGWLDNWINGNSNINYTEGGFAHRADWGSVPVTSSAAYLAQLYHDTVNDDDRYSEFANKQVDYILGDNPAGLSYMVGFGENYPQRPHHRGSAPNLKNDPTAVQENVLYGAVVGGPGEADDFSHNDRRDDWITNEVGTSYNAPFASALIQQYDRLGGDALSMSQLDALAGIDADGVGF